MKRRFLFLSLAILVPFLINGVANSAEIIGTWSNGIWYWDESETKWTKMAASTPTGDIAAGDFTGDGKADVASCWSNGLWYQDGDTLDWTKVSNTAPTQVTAGVAKTAPITGSVVVYATKPNLYSTDSIGSSVIHLNRMYNTRIKYIFGYKISPDKRYVTYWGDLDNDGQEDLDIVPIHGGRVAKIIDFRKRILDYYWAPNSKRIFYQIHDSPPDEMGGLYTVKADGTDYQIIMEHDYSDKQHKSPIHRKIGGPEGEERRIQQFRYAVIHGVPSPDEDHRLFDQKGQPYGK